MWGPSQVWHHLFRSKFGTSVFSVCFVFFTMAAASSGSSYALAATQGVLKLCTFNAACKDDDMYPKKWQDYKADLLNSFARIQEHANMVCLQEVAWRLLGSATGMPSRSSASCGTPRLRCVCVCVYVCVCVFLCVCVCLYLYV